MAGHQHVVRRAEGLITDAIDERAVFDGCQIELAVQPFTHCDAPHSKTGKASIGMQIEAQVRIAEEAIDSD